MKLIWNYLSKNKILLVIYTLMSVAVAGLDIGLAYIMSECVDIAVNEKTGSLIYYGTLFIIYISVFFAVYFFFRKLMYKIEMLVKNNMRNTICNDTYNNPEENIMKKNSGELVSKFTTDVNTINETYIHVILMAIPDMLVFSGSIVLMIHISPILFGIITTISVFQMIIPGKMGTRLAAKQRDFSDFSEKYTSTLSEHLQAYETMRSFGQIEKSQKRIKSCGEKLEYKKYHIMQFKTLIQMGAVTLGNLSYIGLFFVGAILIINGRLTIGSLIGASQLAVYITGPMQTITEAFADIKGTKEVIPKVLGTMRPCKTAPVNQPDSGLPISNFEKIKINDLCFSYADKSIFDNAAFTFERGKNYLIQAPSGSGKSTLADILSGKIKNYSGSIFFDSTNMADILPCQLLKLCAACPQHPFVFNDTIKNNITFFDEAISDEKAAQLLCQVGLSELLNHPGGVNSLIEQNGINLSGGELQRLSIARLLLLDTQFIILDEGMANLDVQASYNLMYDLVHNTTRSFIYISHQEDKKINSLFDHIVTIRDKKIELLRS